MIKEGMKVSVVEGVFAQVYTNLTGIGSNFITKTAVLLNASPVYFSLLTGISQLSQFFQLYAVIHNKNNKNRKKACLSYAFWGRLISVLIGLSFAISKPNLALLFFLSVLFVSASLQTISGNMWVAWMSDLIPKSIRGRYFSFRMQIHLLFGLLFGYLFSFLIDLFEIDQLSFRYKILQNFKLTNFFNPSHLKISLAFLFIIGSVIGLTGLIFLNKQPERKYKHTLLKQEFSLFEPFKNKDFLRLLYFGMFWMFATGIGSPFWGPFMIKTLKLSLIEMQLYTMISSFGMLISFRVWGNFIDKFGNKNAMKICVFLGGINPLFWLFLKESAYGLIWIEALLSGIMWSGANLISFNFVLSLAPRGKEQHWSAVYSALTGLSMLLTIILSGALYPPKIAIFGFILLPEQVLFALTAIFRFSAEIPLHFVRENKNLSFRQSLKGSSDIAMLKIIKFKNRMFKIFKI